MTHSLRHGWTHIVKACDYEQHMASVGQAEANALLVRDMVSARELPSRARLLFPGCGPGQMFEFVSGGFLKSYAVVFTDINPEFVELTGRRALEAGLTDAVFLVDDAESPLVQGPADLAVLVLVLEHVDWRKCLAALAALPTHEFLIVTQKNPEAMTTNVSPHRVMPGSLALAAECEKPHLVAESELLEAMNELGFRLDRTDFRPVLDEKVMCGYWFSSGR